MAKRKARPKVPKSTPSSRTVEDVVRDLETLVPEEYGECFHLSRVFEGFAEMPGRERAIPAMFGVLERFPDADLGSPGPIVHELEAIEGYEPHLLQSLRKGPTLYTVSMVNRILNADPCPDRAELLALLRQVADDESIAATIRENARDYLAHQATRQSPPKARRGRRA